MSDYLRVVCGSCEARALVDDEIVVGSIKSTNKGAGDGSKVLAGIKSYARTSKKIVRLHPWAEDGDHDRLKNWYSRNGFWDTDEGWIFNPAVNFC